MIFFFPATFLFCFSLGKRCSCRMDQFNALDKEVTKKREREEEDEEEEDEEEIDEAKQKELDEAFLNACFLGSLKDVKRTLRAGASNIAQDKYGNSALILACLRGKYGREGTFEIVKFLLSKRCTSSMTNELGQNAVHIAAWYAPAEVMKLLLSKEPHLSQSYDNNRWTPLGFVCRFRFDDDAVRIAEMLLDAGADMEQGDNDWTPLLRACRNGRADLVSFLLERGANVKAVTQDGWNCLHLACENGAFGKDIIPLLIKSGVDFASKAKDGSDALSVAVGKNHTIAETVLQHLPQGSKPTKHYGSVQDPIGSMTMRIKLSLDVWNFSTRFNDQKCNWALLRNGKQQLFDGSANDVFNVLSQHNDPKLWILASREPCFQQHPNTGDTVLHLLCRTAKLSSEQKMEVFAALKKDYRNPLIPNFNNKRAIDLASDPALKLELAKYMEWQPHRSVMHWYGPVFQERAFALLLVLKRYPRAYVKDVRHLLVKYLTKVEHIYVPSKV